MDNGANKMNVYRVLLAALALIGVFAAPVRGAVSLQELVRLEGYGSDEIWGLGIVLGLEGTGDGGDLLANARPVAQLLERGGNALSNLEELAKTRSAALVMVTAKLPATGVKRGDLVDVQVQTMLTAKSLRGGRLFLAPLVGPMPGQGVFAMASGEVTLDGTTETSGRVRGGARMIEDIRKNVVTNRGTIRLAVKPQYASWTTATLIASQVNQDKRGFLSDDALRLAIALDERTVEVRIPEPYLPDPSGFISDLLKVQFDESLLALPARVIVNEARGQIAISGNVTFSPAAVSHANLVVTVVTPSIIPTQQNPRIERQSVTAVHTGVDERSLAKLSDLMNALRQLEVPVQDQIAILHQLHKLGALHGEFIVE